MRILISASGSYGDLLPFVGLARAFIERGHEVVFYTNPQFRPLVESVAARLVPLRTVAQYNALLTTLADGNPLPVFRRVLGEYAAMSGEYHQAMRADVLPGRTLAIGNSLLFGHRLLRETDQVPCATIHLAPCAFRSNIRPSRLVPFMDRFGPRAPEFMIKSMWWLIDRNLYDPAFTVPFNRLRTRLGLPPIDRIFNGWIHEADCVLALFPDWFCEPQADWPAGVALTGFPLYDNMGAEALSPRLEAFLRAGPAPVAISAGTATATANVFFRFSVEAMAATGLRAVLITKYAQQIPASLPDNIIHVEQARFSALLPRVAAFVHHGGIGTTGQALRAGVPQLIRPAAYDQFDNSARAQRLGVARELLVTDYSPQTAADTLTEMIANPAIRQRCADLAHRVETTRDPLATACQTILDRLG